MNTPRQQNGFTLIEMVVSLGLFTIIMFIATSAFLSIVNTDRKSRAVRIAADNLNIALEDMSRRIKTGSTYYCGGGIGSIGNLDCGAGSTSIAFTDQFGVTRISYRLNNNAIERQMTGEAGYATVTSPEIRITGLKFVVSGSAPFPGNTQQPIVVVAIGGSLGTGTASSTFIIQTTITQRAYDN